MDGFNALSQTLVSLQRYFDIINTITTQSDKDPEILLKEQFLSFQADRQYILNNMLAGFGAEVFDAFIAEYFDKVLRTLSWKIPIEDVVLQPELYEGDFVLVGYIDDIPRTIINTFDKTVKHLNDDTKEKLIAEQEDCLQLIQDLEEQLNNESIKSGKAVTKARKEKQKGKLEILITQLGIEKQNLSRINEEIAVYDNEHAYVDELLERYTNRLTNYYQFTLLKRVYSEQQIQKSESEEQ